MSTSTPFKLELPRGDTREYDIKITQDGDNFDLTGCVVFFTAKSNIKLSDTEAELRYSSDNSDNIIIDEGSGGTCLLRIDSADSDTLKPRDYFFDLQVKDTRGYIFTAKLGLLAVLADVTRRTS